MMFGVISTTTKTTEVMIANELRLGNLVDLGNRYAKVISIKPDTCTVVDLEQTQDTIESYNRVKGILLTTDWFIRFGFEKRPEWSFWQKDKLFIDYHKVKDGYPFDGYGYEYHGDTNPIHLQYVHQLQNLYFTLIGKELTIIVPE